MPDFPPSPVVERWEKIAEVEVEADTTTVDFPNLNSEVDKVYVMTISLWNPLGFSCNYYLFINGDETLTNYWCQWEDIAQQDAPYFVTGLLSEEDAFGFGFIGRTPSGYPAYFINEYELGLGMHRCIGGQHYITAPITSLRIKSVKTATGEAVNGIGAGSKFILSRVIHP